MFEAYTYPLLSRLLPKTTRLRRDRKQSRVFHLNMTSLSSLFSLGLLLCFAGSSDHIFAAAQFVCPASFTSKSNRCYMFSVDKNVKSTWNDAHNFCATHTDGTYVYDLLLINDEDEYTLISEELAAKVSSGALIGALNMGQNIYEWFWVNGTRLPETSPLWDCGYPSSSTLPYVGFLAFRDVPVETCSDNTYFLRDVPKTSSEHFICEGPPLPACPTHFIDINNRCYMFSSDREIMSTWIDAQNYCQMNTDGASSYDLLLITDVEEYALISTELIARGNEALIGALDLGEILHDWFWVNGTRLSLQSPLWDCGYPNTVAFDNVALFKYITDPDPGCNTLSSFRLRNVSPTTVNYFICEGPHIQGRQ